jgi:mannose-1-phosphate guanylyltransferase / mannose-6-phosphate isomerase
MKYSSIIKPPQSKKLKSGRVILKSGEDVGWHVTEKREELIIILKGKAKIFNEQEEIVLKEKQTFYISEGKKHNVLNMGKTNLEYIYVVSLFS